MYKTYILIDSVLLGESEHKPWITNGRHPVWIAPIYGRREIEVSPIVVDVEMAIQYSKMAWVMEMVNSSRPQLGISFIDTDITFKKIIEHFRKFIYARTNDDVELTLRFADCAVLPVFFSVFTPLQWTALTKPFKRWMIHDRDGKLFQLPCSARNEISDLPLILDKNQLAELKKSTAADQLLFDLKRHRPASDGTYTSSKAHEYAQGCLRVWNSTKYRDGADLLFFASSVFDTQGKLLQVPELPVLLTRFSAEKFDDSLRSIVENL